MRDDSIKIFGPFRDPPLHIPERLEEDGIIIPERFLDMDHMRRFEYQSRDCPCGRVHGYTIQLIWEDFVLKYRDYIEYAISEGFRQIRRSLDECTGEQW